uniref:RING-type E3 ubiquitin transferase n=1 Tax=Ciona savignyi TaxID=51511 RepID=H2YQB2_CIOSA
MNSTNFTSSFLDLLPRKRQRSTDNWCTSVLECGVCGEQFSLSGDKVPRLLLCGHSFCHDCLTRLPVQAHSLVCPMDRQITDVGSGGVWGLKKNFALIELMEKLQLGGTRINLSKSDSPSTSNSFTFSQMVCCDEDENHTATLYCLVCCTHLCSDCSTTTHSTKTLSKHRRISLEDKPSQPAMCPLHQTHALEFACLEDSCQYVPSMCYLCKEHGKHKGHQHNLIEVVARTARSAAGDASERAGAFLSQVAEHIMRSQNALDRIDGGTRLSTSQTGVVERQQYTGTAESARTCVRDYFCRLREALSAQEEVAISALDSHIRSRITSLRRLHDEATALRSQISTALSHCDNVVRQEQKLTKQIWTSKFFSIFRTIIPSYHRGQRLTHWDICWISSSDNSVNKALLRPICSTLRYQSLLQRNYFKVMIHSQSQKIMNLYFIMKDNRIHIGRKLEIRVVTLGLDGAGKTTLLFKLKQDEFMQPIPTIGFNVETVDYRNLRFTVWDVGGKHKLRPLWKHYYLNTQAVLFVVDSCDTERFEEAHTELAKLMSEKDLREAALLVLANKQVGGCNCKPVTLIQELLWLLLKQDLPGAASCDEITSRLNLHKLCCGRSWRAIPCDASTGSGLEEGLQWLSRQLVAAGVLEIP